MKEDVDSLYPIGLDYFSKKEKLPKLDDSKIPGLQAISDPVQKVAELAWKDLDPSDKQEKLDDILLHAKSGLSVLVHGFGSKIDFMADLADELASLNFWVIQISGYEKNLCLSKCLSTILTSVLKQQPSRSTNVDYLAYQIFKHASKHRLAFVVDSIDGPALRNQQEALATLSTCSYFFASADHMRFGMLWDQGTFDKFRWAFQKVHTCLDYRRETTGLYAGAFPPWCGLGARADTVAANSFAVVMSSLTQNHADLMKMIARMQLTAGVQGVRATDLLAETKRAMLATTSSKLKALLAELIDHAVVKTKKESKSGNEVFYIPGKNDAWERILNGEAFKLAQEATDSTLDIRGA